MSPFSPHLFAKVNRQRQNTTEQNPCRAVKVNSLMVCSAQKRYILIRPLYNTTAVISIQMFVGY